MPPEVGRTTTLTTPPQLAFAYNRIYRRPISRLNSTIVKFRNYGVANLSATVYL